MSAFVAATMRTSTFEGLGWPTGWTSWFSISRSSLGWMCASSSPISSRSTVPPWALRMTPDAFSQAPVNDPRRWPKSCESTISRVAPVQL